MSRAWMNIVAGLATGLLVFAASELLDLARGWIGILVSAGAGAALSILLLYLSNRGHSDRIGGRYVTRLTAKGDIAVTDSVIDTGSTPSEALDRLKSGGSISIDGLRIQDSSSRGDNGELRDG